ncbi:ANKRD17 [Symbiodinium microadriaticum]|nr:ANKRD17 [Symbiodinium microadriaticum]
MGLVSEKLVEDGYSDSCSAAELLCLVQPFSHSEVPGDASRVDMGIEILQKNMQRFEDGTSKVIFQAILSHDSHRTVLRRFGRYPHRNEVLGRVSTSEEQVWLASSDCPGWARSQRSKRS